ncbi:MAG: nucleoside kinase, partial [Spirochaetales bacterium]|nr:nucleoside kinase [Spirochaetales bacterium]
MTHVAIRMPSGESRSIPYGTPVSVLVNELPRPQDAGSAIIAALIDNELVSLSYKLKFNAAFSPVPAGSAPGIATYKRSLCFLLTIAGRQVFPERTLVVGHALGDGYFYTFTDRDETDAEEIKLLDERMRKLVCENLPIERGVISYIEAR